MTDFKVRISDLPGANPLEGVELVPLVQNGETKTRSIQDIVSEGGLTEHLAASDPHPQYAFRVKNNLAATTNPTADDDSTQGYEPTSRWVNTVTEEFFICVTNDAGNANWQTMTLTLDELGSAALANVGAGNGLDADLLDGQHGSYYQAWVNVTGKPSPIITVNGDATGSVTLAELTNGTLTLSIVDDSHNHVISNVDGLQDALDTKVESVNGKTTNNITLVTDDISEDASPANLWYTDSRARNAISVSGDLSYDSVSGEIAYSETYSTPTELLTAIKTVDGSGSGLDADLLDGQSSAYYRNASNLNAGTLPAARFTDTSHGSRSGGSLHAAVTTTTNGFMTSTDKSKLDGIESGATADQTKADIDALNIDADTLDGQHGSYYQNASNLNTGTLNDARLPATITSNTEGNAATATKLATARNIALSGDVTGSANFDGSGDISITATIADDSHNHTIDNVDGLQGALDSKVDKVSGKGLSTEDYTTTEKNKLAAIEVGAEVNTVDTVNGKTGTVVLDTDDVDEGSANLYYTQARFDSAFSAKSTTDLTEGTNLYFTTSRARNAISVSGDLSYNSTTGVITFNETYSTPAEVKTAYESNLNTNAYTDADKAKLSNIASGAEVNTVDTVNGQTGTVVLDTGDVSEGTNLYYTQSRFNSAFNAKSTTDLTEGTNLYFTTTRARAAISVSGDLTYDALNGIISYNETYSTPSELLTAIKTVDGSTSGLDADLLDGKHASAFATAAQGSLANSAVQPGDLASVATSGSYNDLTNKPDLSTLEGVKAYPSRSVFPTTGESGKVYIAEDTGFMYRWDGTDYTQLTDQTALWGQISGTLSDQTDLKNALNGKANTTTQVIAGTGLSGGGNLTANRTLSVKYGTTAGTAAQGNDSRLSNSREWTASVVSQTEAEAGTATTARKWTAQRVRQAIESWWTGSTDKTKLDGIATGATANATDAQLRARSSHTGTQAISTIAGLDTALNGKVDTSDARLSDSREWTAATVSQAEAQAGTATTRRAWTAQRVRQAITGWWNASPDKTKLDGIESGAEVNVATNLGQSKTATTYTITSSTGANTSIASATTTASGVMSAADKTKLNGVEVNANNYTLPIATNSTLGGVKLGSDTLQTVAANNVTSTASRTYRTQLNSSGELVVNIPWVNTNTTYSAMSVAEGQTATSTASRTVRSDYLKQIIDFHSANLINNGTLTLATSGIATGSQTFSANQNTNATFTVNVPGTNLAMGGSGNSRSITSSTGTNVSVPVATTSTAGFMSTGDKTKLNSIEAGAEVNTVDSVNGKTGVVNLTASDVGLGNVRNVSSYSQTEADGRFVNNTGDSMTGTYTINTVDDGVSDLQVGGDVSFRGNTGLGNDDPTYRVDVSGDARVRDENGMKFGGAGAGDAKFSIQYNSVTQSLDFNFLGA